MIAAAVTAFDGSSEVIEDPEIGQIRYYLKQYDTDLENYTVNFIPLKTRLCEQSDLDKDGSPYYPIREADQSQLDAYFVGKMNCLEKAEDMQLWGNYDTN